MPLIRAQCVLPFFTNLPQDVITNTLWFGAPSEASLQDAADIINPQIVQFYTQVYGSGGPADYLALANAYAKYYDWADPEPRQPYQLPLALGGLTEAQSRIPTEVALVLSFHGAPESGVPAARQRGRIYIGGVAESWMSPAGSGSSFPTFATAKITAVRDAAVNLMNSMSTDGIDWVVYSAATGGLTPWFEVVGGWVDNSPDTQRRRSVDANFRNIWP